VVYATLKLGLVVGFVEDVHPADIVFTPSILASEHKRTIAVQNPVNSLFRVLLVRGTFRC
jgi:hypothetical protein